MNSAEIVDLAIWILAALLVAVTAMIIARSRGSDTVRITTSLSAAVPLSLVIWRDWPGRTGYGALWCIDIGCLIAVMAVAIGERRRLSENKWIVIVSLINVLMPILVVIGVTLYMATDLSATL